MPDELERKVIDRLAAAASEERWDVDGAWRRVAFRTGLGRREPLQRPRGTMLALRAAGLLLVVGAGSFAAWRVVSSRRVASSPASQVAVAMVEETAPRGSRRTINLSDGTVVTLNGGSTLRHFTDLTAGPREVLLDGEAFFVVAHNPARPFRVHAGTGVVEDIGTKFSVRAFAERPGVQVVVMEGAVALMGHVVTPNDSATLGAGMMGELRPDGTVTSHRVNAERYTAWTDGRLVFDDATLGDAAAVLGRWFDVDVQLADPALATRRLSAEFRGETLDQVSGAIAVALDIQVRHAGRTLTFSAHPKGP